MAPSLEENFAKMRPRGLTKWLLIACLVVMAARSGEAQGTRVVCYYTNWSVYRPGTAKFNPQNINPYLCTHLIYAFGGFTKENTLKPFDKYQDVEKGGYAKFTGLKTYNPNLKTMIAIGGWNEGSSRFSSLAASAERRRELVKNAIKFLRQNKFDGLDLDWEYPSFRDGGKPKDRANYAKLVQELRQEFEKESEATGRPRLLVTMAVPAGIEYIDKGYDVPKLNRYLDWMNILSYDYHSAFEPAVNHHSPLFALEAASEYNFDAELNIDFSIKHYINAGADRDKLVLGIPTYGRSFTLFNPESNAIGAPADGPGEQGDATREKGYLAYYEICESLMPKEARKKRQADDDEDDEDGDDEEYEEEEEEWTVVQPNSKAMGPYAYKGNQWVGYDDIDIVKKKAEYVAENKLGGIMFWSIDNDDFRGKCHGKPYPLIEAAKGALYKSLGLSEKIPPKKAQPTRKRTRPSKPSKTSDDDKDLSKNTIRNNRKKTRVTEAEVDDDEPTTKASRPRATFAKRGRSTVAPAQADSTPDWGVNTPEPPTTPDPGTDFKCEEEGFFPHPRDCKKYFWCLDSGPSNLGIVAHQFTCPSGLFFNKAADSCDFSRNVVCNVKKAVVTSAPPAAPRTTKTTTTEKPETSAAPRTTTSARPPSNLAALFTTRKPIGRITAATSKTTLLARGTTTVAPAPVEEEDESEEDNKDVLPEVDSEDPKVIKELVDLIKKLGGIEQLEKHLASRNINSGTSSPGTKTTTPATISRLLFERVLSQTRPNGERAPPQINSRGPQASGLAGKDAESAEKGTNSKRGRPQYTTINRGRPSTTTEDSVQASSEDSEEKDEEDEEEDFRRPSSTTPRANLPQYVNIRRARPSTTTEPEPTIRNALFDRDNTESTSDDNDVKNGVQGFDSRVESRFKPEAQESTSSKYKSIQRVRSTTLPTSSEENDATEKSTVLPRGVSKDAPATPSSTTQSPVMTSPKYATVSRFPNTTPLEVSESTTYYSQNDVTEVNDINIDIASPSFASENGIIKKDSSSVLNAQITTLSNIPKSKDEGSNTLRPDPVSYTTDVTFSEKPQSTTQKVPLFAKRTRPTTTTSTTANPPDNTDPTTSANKVSFDRKYVNIKRTRLSPLSNTSSPSLLRSRLDNDIGSDSGKEDIDEDTGRDSVLGESNETIRKDRYRPTVRKIRSTTPASDENKSGEDKKTDDEEANYGNKKFVRPQSRFRVRKLGPVADDTKKETQSSVASTENSLQSTRRFAPRRTESSFRTRKLQTSTSRAADSESNASETDDQSEVLESTSKRPQPRRQFRPSFNSFEGADLSSLTALDFNRKRDDTSKSDTSTGFRNTQVNRRFRPTFTAITKEPVEDSLNSDSSITPVLTQRQGVTIRGARFTTTRSVSRDYDSDQNTEASETSTVPRARKIIRFTPRPFTRATEAVNEEIEEDDSDISEDNELNAKISYGLNSIGSVRPLVPAINVEANRIQTPAIPTSSINVTKVINSNILLGQSNNRSGLLLLRRPSASFLKSGIASVENSNLEENLEGIQLSETNIDEKENIGENPDSLVDRPRKRIIIKKLRTRTTLSDTPTTESTVVDSIKVTVAEDVGIGKNETGKLRIRKVLKRRPATSTTAAEETATETIQNELIESEKNISNKVEEITTKAPLQRIRKLIRKKLKPILTEDGKIHILETKTDEESNSDKITTEKTEIATDKPETASDKPETASDKPESVTDKPEIAEEFTTNYEHLISTDAAEPEIDVDPSTLSTTTTQRYRPSYRPPKRPLNNLSTTTEASTTARVYSRKYNNGPYTTPILPSERDTNVVTDRPRIEGLTRRPTFSVKPFGRKPFTTSRTTTTDDDDEEEVDYSEEDTPTEKTDVEDKLVFVPVDQLFTRGPVARVPDIFALNQGDDVEDNEENEDSEEFDEDVKSEDDEDSEKITTTPKTINRFISPQRPSAPSVPSRSGLPSGRQSNRPLGFNRPVNTPVNQTTSNDAASRRFNRPVAFQPNRPTRFGLSSTQPPTETASKGFVRKFTSSKPAAETPPEVDKEALKAKQKQLFSNPKRFTTTTPVSPSQTVTDENGEYTTQMYQETTTYIGDISNTEFDWLSMTENSEIAEITTIDESSVAETTEAVTSTSENYPTTASNVVKIQTTLESMKESELNETTTTTEPHHIFAVNNNSDQLTTTLKNTEENTIYSVLDTSTDSPMVEKSTEMVYEHGSIKTNSFLDRLFAVSRVVEVSSKQDKHRVNSKNESRLIEAGEIIQEKKPTLDKIGEVSRFTLIKIVEGDIPKYLTNLSHEYPGENPPFNPIRIDEARNARALNNDGGKEQLIASESVAAAYSHKNGYADYVESFVETEDHDNTLSENKVFIVESTTVIDNITTSEASISTSTSTSEASASTSAASTSTSKASTTTTTEEPSTPQYYFVPGAVDLDDRRNNKKPEEVPQKPNNPIESSTLALEGLFKANATVTARLVGADLVPGPQPFVVYAAPQSPVYIQPTLETVNDRTTLNETTRTENARSITNLVKIQVLSPGEEKLLNKEKGFMGVPAAVETLIINDQPAVKSPITITILDKPSDVEIKENNETPSTTVSTSTSTQSSTASTTTTKTTTVEPIVISIAKLDQVVLQHSVPVSSEPTENSITMTTVEPSQSAVQNETIATTELSSPVFVPESNETSTASPADSKISLVNVEPVSEANNTATKRPKLPYTRRYQNNQIKSSNITRIASAPSAASPSGAKRSYKSSLEKNIPFTTPKYNRTNSYTSGKSRFSAIRTQNTPVDARKTKNEPNKFKPGPTTTEQPKAPVTSYTPNSSKSVSIKPFRPSILRSSLFARRTTTTTEATTQDSIQSEEVTEILSSDNTIAPGSENSKTEASVTSKPNPYSRRPTTRFNLKAEQSRRGTTSTTTELPNTTVGGRFSAFGNLRKRPTFERRKPTTSSSSGEQNATEVGALETSTRATRPTRLFVRKFTRGGANNNNATTPRTTTVSGQSPESSTRRSFRVGIRRRVVPTLTSKTTTTTRTTTTSAPVTVPSSTDTTATTSPDEGTTAGISETNDQETHSTIQQIQEKDSSAEKNRFNTKRPFFNGFKNNQFESGEEAPRDGEIVQNTGKKYSSVIKQDNSLVQRERDSTENIQAELSIDDIGGDVTAAVAVAAHQLRAAPLPTIPPYARGNDDERDTSIRTTPSYSLGETSRFHEEEPLTRAYLLASPSSPFVNPNNYLSTTERFPGRGKDTFLSKGRRISTTVSPQYAFTPPTLTTPTIRRRKPSSPPSAFEKIKPIKKTYRTVVDYEYYDEDDIRIVGKTQLTGKVVLLHETGVIQCLDQGNFPHPESCKKFISCAKMENGQVTGWAYTCPKGLSFDPVGGICNWSAGLGCQE